MTIGMIFGMLAISAFNIVDTYFVGKLGSTELAAISFTFPVIMILNSLSWGLGLGVSSTVSRALGTGNRHKVIRLASDGIALSLLIVLVVMAVGIVTIRPLFTLLGAKGKILELIQIYMIIWYVGWPFVLIPMTGNNVIRATGDTVTPSIIMTIAVVINIILDPVLIFGLGPFPAMGIAGAAIATVLARFIALIYSLYILSHREKLLYYRQFNGAETLQNWRDISFIGIPAALVQAINPLSLSVMTRLLSHYGVHAVAGFGAAGRVEMLAMLIPMSMGTVMGPFAGQNWGAGRIDRIRKAVQFSGFISILWGVVVFLLAIFLADSALGLFSKNLKIIQTGAQYLQITSPGYAFLGILFFTSQILNGINKPLESAMISLCKVFVLNIPLAFLGAWLKQETGIFVASLLTNTVSGCLGLIVLRRILTKSSVLAINQKL